MAHLRNQTDSATMRPRPFDSSQISFWLTIFFLTLCVAIYAGHFWVIYQNAVNVPYWDEWGLFDPRALPAGLSFRWIFLQANEHRIALTKLLMAGLFYLNGLNQILSIAITYVLYGVLLSCVVMFAQRMVPHLPKWTTLAFVIFLLTPANWENHFWGFQSAYHFAVLFSLLTAFFLFDESQSVARLALGVSTAVLATYSFFSGLVAVCILIVFFAVFKTLHAGRVSGEERKRKYLQLVAVATPVIAFVAMYFIDYHRNLAAPPRALPYTESFWRFFTNIVSWGFGFETDSVVLGIICLLLVLSPIVLEVWKNGWRLPASSWAVFAYTLAMLAVLAAISVGRGYGGARAKISRYNEFSMMLVPFTLFAWAIFLKDRTKLRTYMLASLWIFCFLGYSYKWLWFPVYHQQAEIRRQGVRCIENYYAHGGEALCPTIHPVSIKPMLDEGKRLNLSFYREVQADSQAGTP